MSLLRTVLAVGDGHSNLQFTSARDVLAFLGNKLVAPIWTDPICGDGKCEMPWEFPAWGRFGCVSDCGRAQTLQAVVLAVHGDFLRHPTLSAAVLMTNTRWNLCLRDAERQVQGEPDLCW